MANQYLSLALSWSGVPRLVQGTLARGKVGILLYHDPRPEALDAHLRYLTRRFEFISLERVVEAARTGSFEDIPRDALVLTIDDGFKENFDLLPVFERYGIRPTIYICSSVVATRRRFWFRVPGVKPEPLKTMSNEARLEVLRETFGYSPIADYPGQEALSADQISKMKSAVDFGSHTRFHPILPECTREESLREISQSKTEIEALTGTPCLHFSFPNGDYGPREVELVKAAGYASARTSDIGWNGPGADPYRLKSLPVSDDATIAQLVAQMTGIPGCIRGLLRRVTARRRPRPASAT